MVGIARFGFPEVYGIKHCNGRPERVATDEWGVFCLECFRWRTYTGPPQTWGDGMRATEQRQQPEGGQ